MAVDGDLIDLVAGCGRAAGGGGGSSGGGRHNVSRHFGRIMRMWKRGECFYEGGRRGRGRRKAEEGRVES